MVLQISSAVVDDPESIDAKSVVVLALNTGEGTDMFLVEHDSPKDGLYILAGWIQRMVWHMEGTSGFVRCRGLGVELFILVISKDERDSSHGFFKDGSQSRGTVTLVAEPVEEEFDLFNKVSRVGD